MKITRFPLMADLSAETIGKTVKFGLLIVVLIMQLSCGDTHQSPKGNSPRGVATNSSQNLATNVPKPIPQGTKARMSLDGSMVIFCTDPGKLDFAMDAAHDGRSHDAQLAMADSAFVNVTGPVTVEVKESDMKSRWPKAFVTILDGDHTGETGWVLVSEMREVKEP